MDHPLKTIATGLPIVQLIPHDQLLHRTVLMRVPQSIKLARASYLVSVAVHFNHS